jgi:hypothetical protein
MVVETNDLSHPEQVLPIPRKRLVRISAADGKIARAVLRAALIFLKAEKNTQRQIFFELMPTVYMFKKVHGFTFKRITAMLARSGLKLTESSVRVYYAEAIKKNEKEYINQVNLQISNFDQAGKETDESKLDAEVAEFMNSSAFTGHESY